MDLQQIGTLIKEQREKQHLSQKELATKAKFQQYEISKLEAGLLQHIGYNRIITILDVLNIQVDIILPKE